jgi:pSer/pThr/pTyr-binding forkhead associated (FHA) protein
MFKLVIQDDEGKTTVVPLIRDEITIGRKEGNTIRLTERNVSRRHARISRNNGEVHIEDLGSYNGIRVNNARIAERVSLRVSDQVQIGDYKLYLKAEGLEQPEGDRAATALDPQSPTESMNSVSPSVTAPQPVIATPVPQLVGSPNRTMVAIGDTDPAGRPVATVATVAALTAPASYGRLVVVSSNFVGKEFELSRPQMIIGRTDENDIVINHRSISRNHAKVTRETETGRYTISDLQSSNGVRVNGQDYGKVELRRADVVDLGHVRLRFVEAGEDFVFDRDAVITDVPEAGGKRGALFVILAAIVLLGAGIAVYMTMLHGADKGDVVAPGPGTNSGLMIDAGETAVAADDKGSAGSAAAPRAGTEAAAVAVGSENPAATVKPDKPDKPDKLDDPKAKKLAECSELLANQKWQDLRDCAGGLETLGAKDKAKEYKDLVVRESKYELIAGDIRRLLHERNLQEAQKLLLRIPPESYYHQPLHGEFAKAEASAIGNETKKAQGFAAAHDCAGLRTQVRQLTASSTPRVAAAVSAVRCSDKAAISEPAGTPKTPVGAASGSASAPVAASTPAQPKGCEGIDVDGLVQQASTQYAGGFNSSALKQMQSALACRQTVTMYRFAAMYACAAHDQAAARQFFAKVPPNMQSGIIQRCQQSDIDVRSQ